KPQIAAAPLWSRQQVRPPLSADKSSATLPIIDRNWVEPVRQIDAAIAVKTPCTPVLAEQMSYLVVALMQ
ncbi:hypothetical protein DVW31_16200, partial [Enterococcus faecium]